MTTPRTTRLTAKEEAFALAIVAGKGPSDAYRAAYGGNGSAKRVSIMAQAVIGRGRVEERIAALRAKAARPAILSRQRKLEILAAMVEKAVVGDEQRTSEQLKALEIDNRMQGHNEAEKLKVTGLGSVLQKIRQGSPKP